LIDEIQNAWDSYIGSRAAVRSSADEAKKTLRKLLKPLGGDIEATIEKLGSGVDHETSRMNRAWSKLASLAARQGKTKQWFRKLDQFLRRFGHFEFNGKLLCESRDILIEQVNRMIEAGVENPTMIGSGARVQLLFLDGLFNQSKVERIVGIAPGVHHYPLRFLDNNQRR
jgi:hypothetical protein